MSIVIENAMSLQHQRKAENRRQVNGRDNSRALGSNNGVAGNGVIEKTVEGVHLEEQVFAELVRVGVELSLLSAAFNFLVKMVKG
ncbi:hypothetical protein OIU84_021917 [Salix udensis]|uniref:Uncharacterized protein n=1 Tax=Salix udensis TaxID=889485 RepID=A0AAD6PJI8_9ROSI|nr:hypothetical protein OIU84_021917 [Salix udensis]